MTADELGQRMDDDVGAMVDRADEVGRCHSIVDDERQAVVMGDLGDCLDVDERAARIGKALDEDRLGLLVDLALEA